MARVKGCGVCWKPVAECICDDDGPEPADTKSSDGDEAA